MNDEKKTSTCEKLRCLASFHLTKRIVRVENDRYLDTVFLFIRTWKVFRFEFTINFYIYEGSSYCTVCNRKRFDKIRKYNNETVAEFENGLVVCIYWCRFARSTLLYVLESSVVNQYFSFPPYFESNNKLKATASSSVQILIKFF